MKKLSMLLLALSMSSTVVLAQAESEANAESQVQVVWKENMNEYRDVRSPDGGRKAYQDRVKRNLNQYFAEFAARYLPEDQKLKLEVIQLDLAGDVRMSGHGGQQVRVMTDVFFPSMTLSYSIVGANDVAISQGEDQLRSMNYLRRSEARRYNSDSFPHEKVMIEDWFKAKFSN